MIKNPPLVGVIMGSTSDWQTMRAADEMLADLGIVHENKVISAHRTPQWMAEYALSAEERGIEVIIAGAGGAAHLPGMVAAYTTLPVLGVPVQSRSLNGLDSLLSIVQMPGGIPVGTLAIGGAGAKNAALLAAAILGIKYPQIRQALKAFRDKQTEAVLNSELARILLREAQAAILLAPLDLYYEDSISWFDDWHFRQWTVGTNAGPCREAHGLPHPCLFTAAGFSDRSGGG
jgi:5-(carboxyamino)imidazole ribonucleotide mutase